MHAAKMCAELVERVDAVQGIGDPERIAASGAVGVDLPEVAALEDDERVGDAAHRTCGEVSAHVVRVGPVVKSHLETALEAAVQRRDRPPRWATATSRWSV
jgi:hypothetical protein